MPERPIEKVKRFMSRGSYSYRLNYLVGSVLLVSLVLVARHDLSTPLALIVVTASLFYCVRNVRDVWSWRWGILSVVISMSAFILIAIQPEFRGGDKEEQTSVQSEALRLTDKY